MNHPVEFSLNLYDDIQVQFRFMRAPLANKGHYKAMERSIYSLILKMKLHSNEDNSTLSNNNHHSNNNNNNNHHSSNKNSNNLMMNRNEDDYSSENLYD